MPSSVTGHAEKLFIMDPCTEKLKATKFEHTKELNKERTKQLNEIKAFRAPLQESVNMSKRGFQAPPERNRVPKHKAHAPPHSTHTSPV